MILPATSFMEKEGTYTNTDRRVQIGRKTLDPPGEARVDWRIICEISNRVGHPMDYESPSEIFDELVSVMPNYAGLPYDNLAGTGKLYPNPDPLAQRRHGRALRRPLRHRGRQGAPRRRASGCRRRSCPTTSTRSC